ncbi:MAG: hypothetical protein HZB53_13120 [Chloroflexi bacterium]|nr:hypothetical protein [Chloroflexota bacterium]
MDQWKSIARVRFPLMAAIALLSGLSFVIAQQVMRQSANDSQIQMAEDAAQLLGAGTTPAQVDGAGAVEISQSLALYLIVFDSGGKVLASSARLHGLEVGAVTLAAIGFQAQMGLPRGAHYAQHSLIIQFQRMISFRRAPLRLMVGANNLTGFRQSDTFSRFNRRQRQF